MTKEYRDGLRSHLLRVCCLVVLRNRSDASVKRASEQRSCKEMEVSLTISTDPVSRNKDKLSNTSVKINDILVAGKWTTCNRKVTLEIFSRANQVEEIHNGKPRKVSNYIETLREIKSRLKQVSTATEMVLQV